MGKHEFIKPKSSIERVRKHRDAMKAKGYRLKQQWVLDTNDSAIRARIQEECRTISELERKNPVEYGWMDELVARAWDDLPEQ